MNTSRPLSNTDLANLALDLRVTPRQIELAIQLMRSGRSDLVAGVVSGEIGLKQALAASRKQRVRP
jgi:hypothetical protein